MKIKIEFTVFATDHEVTEMLKEANKRGYPGTDLEKLKQLIQRDGTSAIDSVPPRPHPSYQVE